MRIQYCISEAIGTFVLVFAGTGAIIVEETMPGRVTHVGIALTFGLVVTAMIFAFGETSGAHLNPAITLGLTIAGRFPFSQTLPYMASQLLGAMSASVLLRLLFTGTTLGVTSPAGTATQTFALEVVLSAILMFVVLMVSRGPKESGLLAGLAVGSVIAVEALFAGPITGASMNPVRSLAPALVTMQLDHLYLYLIAPVMGAMAAVAAHRAIAFPELQPKELS